MACHLLLLAGLVGSSAAAAINLTAAAEGGSIFRRDSIQPLPECRTYADNKWQPILDFDTDSCYNVAAISPNGVTNPGLNCRVGESYASNCRDRSHIDRTNVYSRARCNSGWCAHMYAYYFEKDQTDLCLGHIHDWEHIVVWTRNDRAEYVSVSQHGNYEIRPRSGVQWSSDGNRAKVVYHKHNVRTHAFRFGTQGDDTTIENHVGQWIKGGPLISYYGYASHDLRNRLLSKDFGSASIDFRNVAFQGALDKAKPPAASAFKSYQDGPEDIHNSPGIPEGGCGIRS
ncbi:NLP4 protein [Podospora didyma]|uniref:NLP4 protein n=1 Tax=Podospora didyma TaxID=330526 RepID=A0AAE0N603_9PEZI|nr:NLP4 protein [Podospora didyma]